MYSLLKNFSKLPLRLIQVTARSVGWLLYVSNSSARRVTEINLKSAYPELSESERDQLTKRSLKSQCMTYAESVKIWGSAPEFALEQIKVVHGEDIFLDALQNPNGTLAVVPHFGTWELMNAWVNLHTAPVIMYKPSKNPDVDRFMLEARQRLNATLVPTDETGVRALFKHLKQGGLTVILPDHLPKPSGGIYANFFNQNVLSGTIVPKLAQKTQCNVVGISCIRTDHQGCFDIHCTPFSDDIKSKDIKTGVLCLNQHMEYMIALAPAQYIWSYKRFRNCSGDINPYRQ